MNYFYLSWGTACGRIPLNIHKDDIDQVYKIVQAFLNRGKRIYMNDQSQITFEPGDYACIETHQKKKLCIIYRLIELKIDPRELCSLPIDKSEFWVIPEGKFFVESKILETITRKSINP